MGIVIGNTAFVGPEAVFAQLAPRGARVLPTAGRVVAPWHSSRAGVRAGGPEPWGRAPGCYRDTGPASAYRNSFRTTRVPPCLAGSCPLELALLWKTERGRGRTSLSAWSLGLTTRAVWARCSRSSASHCPSALRPRLPPAHRVDASSASELVGHFHCRSTVGRRDPVHVPEEDTEGQG